MTDALLSFALCLPVGALLIRYTPALDGDATRELERAAEALEWLIAMGVMK